MINPDLLRQACAEHGVRYELAEALLKLVDGPDAGASYVWGEKERLTGEITRLIDAEVDRQIQEELTAAQAMFQPRPIS